MFRFRLFKDVQGSHCPNLMQFFLLSNSRVNFRRLIAAKLFAPQALLFSVVKRAHEVKHQPIIDRVKSSQN